MSVNAAAVLSIENPPAVILGAAHGYTLSGDQAYINAELDVLDAARAESSEWALQLWAAELPYEGDAPAGVKVAELPLGSLRGGIEQTVTANGYAFARPPAGTREQVMRLILASGTDGQFDHIHAVARYPRPERFLLPCLLDNVGYRFTADAVELTIGEIRNPREPDNLSGTLALELWALPEPYAGGDFAGVALAGVMLDSIPGQSQRRDLCLVAQTRPVPPGQWSLVLMLREWTCAGYVTRDYVNFSQPYVREIQPDQVPAEPVLETAPVVEAVTEPVVEAVTEPVVEAVAEPVVEAAPVKSAPKKRQKQVKPTPQPVAVNTASEAELTAIKGIDKKVAQAIIAKRPFATLDDLLRVKGIGNKRLDRLRSFLIV